MTFYGAFWLCLYFICGAGLGYLVDRAEMKEQVPFAKVPAILSTQQIRKVMFAICVLLGPLIIAYALPKAARRIYKDTREDLIHRRRLRRAIRDLQDLNVVTPQQAKRLYRAVIRMDDEHVEQFTQRWTAAFEKIKRELDRT